MTALWFWVALELLYRSMSHSFAINPRLCNSHVDSFNINLSLFQYQRGRCPHQQLWMFGMVDTSHHPSLGYMQIVDARDAAMFLPIIQAHTAPGTIIHSDEWAAYASIAATIPHLQHKTVNHSLEYVNRTDCTHTQNIESY